MEDAIAFCDRLLSAPTAMILHPAQRHWSIFTRLCRDTAANGNLLLDAWFAALEIEHGCKWVTLDRDFGRFPGLRVEAP